MYYENKKEKRKETVVVYFFMVVIVLLLCVLVLKFDNGGVPQAQSNYETTKLSGTGNNINTAIDEEKEKYEIIEKSTKCIVGISKLQQSGSSVFLDDAEEKLGLGSGIIITDNGYILTNQHVAGNKYSNCYVTLECGDTYSGSVVWEDDNIDLAIVKISKTNLDYMPLADSDNINLGQDVYAIGNPIGFEFQRTVTKGIISGIDRTIKIDDDQSIYMEDLIQTDATINEGNSGGALINTKGELIGVNTVKISTAEAIGFAVPINIVKPIIEKLVGNNKFEEAYLGLYGYDKEVIPYLDHNLQIECGVYIATILFDSPLYKSEVMEGDVIMEIDHIKINKMNDLKKYIYSKNPGDTVNLIIKRKTKEFSVNIKLGYKM